jgi:hypothetical protein
MIKSDSIDKIAAALAKAQANILAVKKEANNPFFRSTYADLTSVIDAVKGPLLDQGITILQPTDGADVTTILLHVSGEYLGSRTPIRVSKENDPQALGSAISYARRYGLQALVCLSSVDDDGEQAMARPKTKKAANNSDF